GVGVLQRAQHRPAQRARVIRPVDQHTEWRAVRPGEGGRIAADLAAEHLVAALPAPGVEKARRRQRADAGGVHGGRPGVPRAGYGDVLDLDAGKAPEVREREVVHVVEVV